MNTAFTVQRIKELVKNNGLKMQYLCEKVDVRVTYFSDCKSKNLNISEEVLRKTARILNTTVEYLKGETDDPVFHLSSIGMTTYPCEREGLRPIFGQASAGLGVIADQEVLGYAPVDIEHDNDEYFWLKVNGDSMAPLLTDGDLVLVQRDAPIETNTIMVVIVDDNDGFVKQVSVQEDTVTLHSVNPYYPPKVFGGAELGRLRFVGRVVEQKRKF